MRVCVFAGASEGSHAEYKQAAAQLGTSLAAQGIEIVYGGGALGLMGALSQAALAAGGRVIGILPQQLADLELAQHGLTETLVVQAMHDRKARFHEKSDAFVVLPGGVGTYDELFETLAWLKLGIHRKPIVLVNVREYFDPLLQLMRHTEECGFVGQDLRLAMHVVKRADEVFRILSSLRLEAAELRKDD